MLLEIVGLDEKWEQGIACEYETPEFSLHDGQDVLTHLPLAIQALYPTSEARRQLDFHNWRVSLKKVKKVSATTKVKKWKRLTAKAKLQMRTTMKSVLYVTSP